MFFFSRHLFFLKKKYIFYKSMAGHQSCGHFLFFIFLEHHTKNIHTMYSFFFNLKKNAFTIWIMSYWVLFDFSNNKHPHNPRRSSILVRGIVGVILGRPSPMLMKAVRHLAVGRSP